MNRRKLLKRYIEYGKQKGYWRRGIAYKHQCRHQIYSGINIRDRNILDIGCGNGRFSVWAAIHGASEVLGLEPVLEGSKGEPAAEFREAAAYLGLDNTEIREQRFQDFVSPEDHWDVVLMRASVNHLAEEACVTLAESDSARREYMEIFSKLYSVTAPGGRIIITDCSRENKYANLGEPNPYAPTIEWEKHQRPELWAGLLEEAGFENPCIRWIPPARYLYPGKILLSNHFYAYRRDSRFRLEVSRPVSG